MTKIGQMGAAGLLKTSIGADNVATLFTDQKAAFMVSGPWNLPAVVKSGVKNGISDLPKFADGTVAQPFIGAQNLYVAAKGKNKALAQEYATNFFIQPEVAKAPHDVQPRPPALQSVYDEVAAGNTRTSRPSAMQASTDSRCRRSRKWLPFSIRARWGKAPVNIVGGADPTTTTQQLATTINGILGNS